MSNQYNNAGRSLIIDEVIELKGTEGNTVSNFRQQLDAQLIRRDTQAVMAQVNLIASDSYVSVQEKQVLAREYGIIGSNHGLIVAKAEEYQITGQTRYLDYLTAYQALCGYLDVLLANMQEGSPIDSHQEMNQLFGELYRTSTEMEETYFRYATGLLDGLDDREKFEVVVNSSLGITVPTDNTPTTLSVMLLRDGTDVTGGYDDAAFTWERISEDREADAQWRGGVPPVGKTLTVSYEDLVFGYASFLCRFRYQYSESMFYAKSGSIVLSKEVPGPQGEQGEAYVVVIESSNGDVFKPGELMMTTLRARVFLNGEEVTAQLPDSAFKWKRKSYYEPNDDEAWNSAHVAGYRQIDVTADDVSDRATFFCEIVL